MDEYESGVYIDEGRTEVDIVRSDRKVPPKEEGNAVMFEVASVFAKLHNVPSHTIRDESSIKIRHVFANLSYWTPL